MHNVNNSVHEFKYYYSYLWVKLFTLVSFMFLHKLFELLWMIGNSF